MRRPWSCAPVGLDLTDMPALAVEVAVFDAIVNKGDVAGAKQVRDRVYKEARAGFERRDEQIRDVGRRATIGGALGSVPQGLTLVLPDGSKVHFEFSEQASVTVGVHVGESGDSARRDAISAERVAEGILEGLKAFDLLLEQDQRRKQLRDGVVSGLVESVEDEPADREAFVEPTGDVLGRVAHESSPSVGRSTGSTVGVAGALGASSPGAAIPTVGDPTDAAAALLPVAASVDTPVGDDGPLSSATGGSNLSWGRIVASPFGQKPDLELRCDRCGHLLCDVESGDDLNILLHVFFAHTCGDAS